MQGHDKEVQIMEKSKITGGKKTHLLKIVVKYSNLIIQCKNP